MAFGTGDHPTTSMCLKAIETYVDSDNSVIDVGTGSGILSIASHLLGVKKLKLWILMNWLLTLLKKTLLKSL